MQAGLPEASTLQADPGEVPGSFYKENIQMRRIVRLSLGVILILLGVPGLVLPVLQGWLFLALGALLLSVDLPLFDQMVRWIEKRVPQIKKPLERMRNFLRGSRKRNNG